MADKAREVFPCFDSDFYKTRFEVFVTAANMTVLGFGTRSADPKR